MVRLALDTQTLEDFLARSQFGMADRSMGLRIPISIGIALSQVKHNIDANYGRETERYSLIYLHTGVLDFGTHILHQKYTDELLLFRRLMARTTRFGIDLDDYNVDTIFGANKEPRREDKLTTRINVKPSDALGARIGLLKDLTGYNGSWIQRTCIAQGILLSRYVNDGSCLTKTKWDKEMNPYLEEFNRRALWRLGALEFWLSRQ